MYTSPRCLHSVHFYGTCLYQIYIHWYLWIIIQLSSMWCDSQMQIICKWTGKENGYKGNTLFKNFLAFASIFITTTKHFNYTYAICWTKLFYTHLSHSDLPWIPFYIYIDILVCCLGRSIYCCYDKVYLDKGSEGETWVQWLTFCDYNLG